MTLNSAGLNPSKYDKTEVKVKYIIDTSFNWSHNSKQKKKKNGIFFRKIKSYIKLKHKRDYKTSPWIEKFCLERKLEEESKN